MTWFSDLFGVRESTYAATQSSFALSPDPTAATSQILIAPNNRHFPVGTFTTPSLATLRSSNPLPPPSTPLISLTHIAIGDVLSLHAAHPNATFQAASQFNALEFPSPSCVPEDGITAYASDCTQGPACSLVCAAACFFRNYKIPVASQIGQTTDVQLDMLRPLLDRLPGGAGDGVVVRNGYTSAVGAEELAAAELAVRRLSSVEREDLLGELRVAVHRRVGVVFRDRWKEVAKGEDLRVTQVFCSALSLAYDEFMPLPGAWEALARTVLDACYEAVLLVAAEDKVDGVGTGEVFLTFVGGGVFGNKKEWIADAIGRAVKLCRGLELDVRVCHYRAVDNDMMAAIDGAASP